MKKILLITTLIASSLSGCKMAATLYYEKHPNKLADKCAREFPVKTDSTSHDSTSHTQAITNKTDTLPPAPPSVVGFDCDSAQRAARAEGFASGRFMIPCPTCPPSTHTTTTIHDSVDRWHNVVVTKENTAALDTMSAHLEKTKSDYIKEKKSAHDWRIGSLIQCAAILIVLSITLIRLYLRNRII